MAADREKTAPAATSRYLSAKMTDGFVFAESTLIITKCWIMLDDCFGLSRM